MTFSLRPRDLDRHDWILLSTICYVTLLYPGLPRSFRRRARRWVS